MQSLEQTYFIEKDRKPLRGHETPRDRSNSQRTISLPDVTILLWSETNYISLSNSDLYIMYIYIFTHAAIVLWHYLMCDYGSVPIGTLYSPTYCTTGHIGLVKERPHRALVKKRPHRALVKKRSHRALAKSSSLCENRVPFLDLDIDLCLL